MVWGKQQSQQLFVFQMKRRVYVWEKKCSVNTTGHDLDAIFVTLVVMEKTEKEKWKSGKDWNMV